MLSGPSTRKAPRQQHQQTKLGNVLSQFGKGETGWEVRGPGGEKEHRREGHMGSLCETARPRFKIIRSSPLEMSTSYF